MTSRRALLVNGLGLAAAASMPKNARADAAAAADPYGIQRTRIATGLPYDDLVRNFEDELGRWDPAVRDRLVKSKASWSDVEQQVAAAAGPHGLMIFARIDQGQLISLAGETKRCSLYLVGNPVIANKIIAIDIRGSFYVPFRVGLFDDGTADGGAIIYDRPSSFLASLGHAELAEIGNLLDQKIDAVARALRKP
jgi:uncharacterized protein (DUF302 family)